MKQYSISLVLLLTKVKLIFLSCGSKERPDGVKNATVALKEAGFNAVSYIS